MSRSKSETAIFSIFLQFFDRIRAVKIGLWDDKMKVDLVRLKNRSKLRFRHTFREKFGVLGLKMVEIGQKSLFLVISDCSLAVSDRKSHKISFSLAKMDSRAHFKIEIRVLRFVSENRFLVIWGLVFASRAFFKEHSGAKLGGPAVGYLVVKCGDWEYFSATHQENISEKLRECVLKTTEYYICAIQNLHIREEIF